MTHLNVGQGDAAVVELPNSQVLLIDAGGTATATSTSARVSSRLTCAAEKFSSWTMSSSVIHASIITAAWALSSMNSRRENFGRAPEGPTSRFEDLEEILTRSKIARVLIGEATPCQLLGEVRVCALLATKKRATTNPWRSGWSTDSSATCSRATSTSAMKRRSCRKGRYARERRRSKYHAMAMRPRALPEFVAAAKSQLAVISAGARSRSEAQREEIVERYRLAGAEVLRTYDDGAIIVESDGKTLRYLGYKSGKTGIIDLTAIVKK